MLLEKFNRDNFPHAILVNEAKLCDLQEFIDHCKKILNVSNAVNFLVIDGHSQTIKKEEVLEITRQFRFSTNEGDVKIYVIYGLENATAQAINSLLKFLEEPPSNTYAILTTRNLNGVLPTIKSRCQIFRMTTNLEKIEMISKKFNLTNEQQNIAKAIYYDFNFLMKDLESELFFKNYDFAKTMISNYDNPQIIKEKSEIFKKMTYQEIVVLLKVIGCLINSNLDLLKLIDAIKLTPSRLMIFNRL
jgi:DNA polymerase-3 subunit delta'